jgi:N-methylhydantoinase B/oxoprolinase/acetone carboxylase alpha subunit
MDKKELKKLIRESIREVKQEQWIEYTKDVIKKTREFVIDFKKQMKKDGYDVK